MSDSTCSQTDCDREVAAKGLCMKHYQRAHYGRPLELPESLTCESCLVEFKPKYSNQKHCTRQCGSNMAVRRFHGYEGPVARTRACDYCGAEFTRKGRGRRTYCSPECAKTAQSVRSHLRDYGVTKAQYRAMLEAQDGVCGSCGRPETQRRKTLLSVDHNHETGEVRGLLCGGCNAAIGLLGDTVEGVRKALAYMERTSSLRSAAS